MPPAFKFRDHKLKLLAAVMAVVTMAAVIFGRVHIRHAQSDAEALQLLREAYSAVLENYVEKPDSKKLVLKMVDGMLAALDPHSAYLPPEPYHEMAVTMSGSFGGIGVELGMKEGRLTVISPIDDTPAFRAGIQANDHIWKIDGTPTDGMNISAAVKRMRGEKGTTVSLTIMRGENAKPLAFKLVRDIIKLKSVKYRLLDSGYGFVRISQFQERTGSEFKEALRELHLKSGGGLKGLILDLRYNPGGLVSSCVEVVNCYIGDDVNNTAIVTIKGRTPEASHVYNATVGVKEPRYPIIVLINGGSASASEIVAGALQDHKRAIILGTQSFGKGSVQSVIPMKGDAALKLTTALYYTPSGRSIQAKGIAPDIEVANVKSGVIQEQPKRREIKEKDLENRLAPTDKPEEKQVETPVLPKVDSVSQELQNDFQLRRAVELLQSITLLREQGLVSGR